MRQRKHVFLWGTLALAAAVAIGVFYGTRVPRYRLHAGGAVRFDTETGRSEVLMEGKWVPLPEVRPAKLQSRIDAALAEALQRQLVAPGS